MDGFMGAPQPEPESLKGRLTRHADVALAVLVVAVVGMMIVPMPTWLLDILISTNIAASVILLLTAIYVTNPLRIATFPTLLLITTLYRLALNVSSTRLILLQADAGAVIQSFGDFVVAGNMVVGAVIFLILTLIQFIVIAKGSERVAEVAARFTLDAMPGKQMAIDADLRAGIIDQEGAAARRQELERESQMYGSMDGAMKFVKGDAIAGILITLINITAGLIIGLSQMGMSWSEALATYSILTIGDGLVSQIPALIISTSAGMIVTRVAAEDESTHLGTDIGSQVLAQPKAIGIAAILMGVLALIPGLPTVPFLILGVLCGTVAWGLMRTGAAPEGRAPEWSELELGPAALEASKGGGEAEGRRKPMLVEVITVEVGAGIVDPADGGLVSRLVADGGQGRRRGLEDSRNEDARFDGPRGIGPCEPARLANELLPRLRERFFSRLGVVLPPLRLRHGPDLDEYAYRIRIKEIPAAVGEIPPDGLLVRAAQGRLAGLGLTAEPAATESPQGVFCWVDCAGRKVLEAAEISFFAGEEILVTHLESVLFAHAGELMNIQQAHALVDTLEQTHPDLVAEIVPKRVPFDLLTEVLKRLVEEGVCVRNVGDILEILAGWTKGEKDPVLLTEYVRMGLKRQITHQYAGEKGFLAVYMLDPMIEDTIAEAVQKTATGSYLALDPELSRDILENMKTALGAAFESGANPVILTRMEIRRYVKKLIEVELAGVHVLSFQELMPGVEVRPVGHITAGPSDVAA
jgi:type III secretion protein V